MIRQENAVPIFTYDNEDEEVSYGTAEQGGKRNPYLADYAAQRRMQSGGSAAGPGGAKLRRPGQDNAGRNRIGDFGDGEGGVAVSGDVDILIRRLRPAGGRGNGPSRPMERVHGQTRPRPVGRNGAAGAFGPQDEHGERRSDRRPDMGGASRTASRRPAEMPRTVSRRPAEMSHTASRRPAEIPRTASRRSAEMPHTAGRRPTETARAVSRRSADMPRTGNRQPRRRGLMDGSPSARTGGIDVPLRLSAQGAVGESRRPGSPQNRSARRKKHSLLQRLIVVLWAAGILVLAFSVMLKDGRVANAQNKPEEVPSTENAEGNKPGGTGVLVQGLPAEDFASHPEWTENLLTPNEYSRPGDALESVKNIFVHYTANPGTSAAQNRSYFEQQKDTHERSVSSHFIIGYEGEILQCVPLDEIAYAVAGRNNDSISIECCFLASDGSFTQETYDSLISLLAWLVDIYGLDSDDILRHYDCGGKKCPIYYTENPGEWEQLKKDVDKL